MRVFHAADLHLDSPLRGLERYPHAPHDVFRGATRGAFTALVDACLEEEAALLLLAGDLFDGDWPDNATGVFFLSELARLRKVGTRVVLVRGNHDAASIVHHHLRLPEHVHELPVDAPGTLRFEDLGVAVHGQGHAVSEVREDLAARYPEALPGWCNIGLLHTALTGAEGHGLYAPTSLEVLRARGYQYWALGHVHGRRVVSEEPWVVFPGNLQGRHARECGEKGAISFEVQGGRITAVTPRVFDRVRWVLCEVDLEAASSLHDVLDLAVEAFRREVLAAGGRPVAVRLVLRGVTRAHAALERDPEALRNNLRLVINTESGGQAWLERVVVETRPAAPAALAARQDAVGHFARAVASLREAPEEAEELIGEIDAELAQLLPPEARQAIRRDALREALGLLEHRILPKLAGEEAPS